MSTLAVDAEGNRIETDILVCGYIREKSEQYRLSIPGDINSICFLFWLIKVCDQWDSKYASKYIKIDGHVVESIKDVQYTSVYGCHCIDKGTHTWEMEVNQIGGQFLLIGLIEDEPNILEKSKKSAEYVRGHGCVLYINDGKFYRGSTTSGNPYISTSVFGSKNYRIQMTLDMDNHKLCYAVNGKDYGVATNELDKQRYRMVVTFFYEYSIKLL